MFPFPKFSLNLKPGQSRTVLLVLLVVIVFASSTSSFAQDTGFHLLDKVDSNFATQGLKWNGVITKFAQRLFWLLAVPDFCFMCATFVLDKKELEDMMASVIKKLMTLGFFWTVLMTSNTWIG